MSSQKPKTIPDISLQLIPQLSYYKVLLILPPESFFNLSIFLQLPCNHLSSSYQCPGLDYSLRTDSYGILTGLQVSTLTFLQTIFQTAPDALLKMLIWYVSSLLKILWFYLCSWITNKFLSMAYEVLPLLLVLLLVSLMTLASTTPKVLCSLPLSSLLQWVNSCSSFRCWLKILLLQERWLQLPD